MIYTIMYITDCEYICIHINFFLGFCIFNFLFNQHIKLQIMYHGQTNRLITKENDCPSYFTVGVLKKSQFRSQKKKTDQMKNY